MEIREIRLDEISVSDLNTRKDLDAGTEDAGLEDLANSIRESGLLSPITVRTRADEMFDLIVGQRRYLACKTLGMKTIPAIIRDDLDDTDATIVSLVENVHRADMNPIDKSRAYKQIFERYGNYGEVAKQTGVSIPTVRKYMRLLDLAPSIQEKLSTAEGPAGVSSLSKLAETFAPDQQEEALREIGGFKQTIQLDMLKGSEGNLDLLSALKEKALEGAFDVRTCREGLCFAMPEQLKAEIKRVLAQGQNLPSLKDIA